MRNDNNKKRFTLISILLGVMILAMSGFFATAGFTSSTKKVGAADSVTAELVTHDMLTNDNSPITASQFPGFKAVSENEAMSWDCSGADDMAILIFDIASDYIKVAMFQNGQYLVTNDLPNLNSNVYTSISSYDFFYTKEPGGESGEQEAWTATPLSYNLFGDNSDNVTAKQFPGFKGITFDEAKAWTPDVQGIAVLIYDIDGENIDYCIYNNGNYSTVMQNEIITNKVMRSDIYGSGYSFFFASGGEQPSFAVGTEFVVDGVYEFLSGVCFEDHLGELRVLSGTLTLAEYYSTSNYGVFSFLNNTGVTFLYVPYDPFKSEPKGFTVTGGSGNSGSTDNGGSEVIEPNKLPTAAIVGIALGGAIAVLLIYLLVFFLINKGKKND